MNTLLVRLSSMGDLIHTLPAISDLARHRRLNHPDHREMAARWFV